MTIKWNKLNLKSQHRNTQKIKKLLPIGLDTETDSSKNICELLAAETGDYIHPCSFSDIIEFLLNKSSFRKSGSCFVFYNLQFDVQSFLKWCDLETWEILWETGTAVFDGYELFLIPWKLFRVKKISAKKVITFYDIAQFYEYLKLDVAAKRYLGKQKLEVDDITNLDLKSQKTIDYCINDAKLAGELARYILSIHKDHFPNSPPSLISKASVSEKHFMTTCNIPTINNVMREKKSFIKIAYKTYKGGFFEAFKKGYFEKVFLYDINSAYPYHMAKLPDISEGMFKSKLGLPLDSAMLGWMLVDIEVDDDKHGYFNPVAIDIKGSRFYPYGRYRTYITLSEYKTLSPYYIIEPIYGVYWYPDTFPIRYPFKAEIDRLYQWKQSETDPILKMYVKIILNSIYGKNIQKTPNRELLKYDTGNMFNPFYASYITAETRLQIFRVLATLPTESIIMVATDSILTKTEIDIPIDNTLGGWGLEKTGSAVVLGSGVYTIKENTTYTTKRRGFRTIDSINFMDLDNLSTIDSKILISVKNHISLAKAIISKDFNSMNLILNDTRTMDINFDYKRNWKKRFANINEIVYKEIDSKPLLIDLI